MGELANIFKETHDIPYYECDATGHLTLPMILNVVIKTSESQSDSLGRGTQYMTDLGLGWVITQHDITINQLPKVGEVVTVSMQAKAHNKFFCYREFWIHNEAGEECVHVETTFVVMDLVKRKIGTVPDEVIAPFGSEKSNKIKRPEKFVEIEASTTKSYHVRFTDIDSNRHVNNTKYLEWMVDGLDYDFLMSHQAKNIVMKFDKELYYSDEVTAETALSADESISIHMVSSEKGQSSSAQITWEKR